ncbi:MAG: response regulator [bacterium]
MNERILIVDDSLTIRRALEMILGPQDFELRSAGTGKDALEEAARFDPDLILLDYVLPDMRGPDVCAALEQIPITRDTPVILVSAKGASIRQAYNEARNVVSYITKPFKPQVVLTVVGSALSNARRHQRSAATPDAVAERAPGRGSLASLEDGFHTLLEQLEFAASRSGRLATTAPNAEPDPAARLVELLARAQSEIHTPQGAEPLPAARSFRLREDGSLDDLGGRVLRAHAALVEAALLLAAESRASLCPPRTPGTLLVGLGDGPMAESLRALRACEGGEDTFVVHNEFATLPHLAAMLAPVRLAVAGAPNEELQAALARCASLDSVSIETIGPEPYEAPAVARHHESLTDFTAANNAVDAIPGDADLRLEVLRL